MFLEQQSKVGGKSNVVVQPAKALAIPAMYRDFLYFLFSPLAHVQYVIKKDDTRSQTVSRGRPIFCLWGICKAISLRFFCE
jgi:hypothetical protein